MLAGGSEIGRLGLGVVALERQQALLAAQSANGLAATNVGDLGASASTVLHLQPELAQLAAWSGSVTAANSRLAVTQSALGGIGAIATSLTATLTGLEGDGNTGPTVTIEAAAAAAKADLASLGSLLNTRSGDTYVFAGSDTANAPVPDPSALADGALFGAIGGAVASVGADGASTTLAAVLGLAGSTVTNQPFSAALSVTPSAASSDAATVAVGAATVVTLGIGATASVPGSQPSATSTGSPIRDLVAVLSAVANLPSSGVDADTLTSFATALGGVAGGAATGITAMSAALGTTQDLLGTIGASYDGASTALTAQIGTLTSVDAASVATSLSATNTALQASYQLIADLKSLSLANYL